MASLNVIALISGGKDSFYAHLQTLYLGHRVVALANLHPPLSSSSVPNSPDLNSHMYQTAGHALIPLYSQALGLPLYRAPITGHDVNRSSAYEIPSWSSKIDETEALVPLLKQVKEAHPGANAVVSGAILSEYQRTRVESVCIRLGLVPLAWLWQWPFLPTPVPSPRGLLLDIAAAGLEARIVKVASGGLDERHLWGNLAEERFRERIVRAEYKYDIDVLGEGGEYETLVLKGPKGVWKGRLVVEKEERVKVNGGAGAYGLGFSGGRLEIFENDAGDESDAWKGTIKRPELWDEKFKTVNEAIKEGRLDCSERRLDLVWHGGDLQSWQAKPVITKNKGTLRISNLTCSKPGSDAFAQMRYICDSLLSVLVSLGLTPRDLVFTTIILRSMSTFSTINQVYGSLFEKPNPPARATISCGSSLPDGCEMMLSVVADLLEDRGGLGLHVQSRSYWAPANIGPYSQAISLADDGAYSAQTIFVAGQIPLVPHSMEPLVTEEATDSSSSWTSDFAEQVLLSAQHMWRIGSVMKVSWWTGAVAFIAHQPSDESHEKATTRARVAWKIWKQLHVGDDEENEDDTKNGNEDDSEDGWEDCDVWDRRYGNKVSMAPSYKHGLSSEIPDWTCLLPLAWASRDNASVVPGLFAVEVDELPRGCSVEWLSVGFHARTYVDEDAMVIVDMRKKIPGDITGVQTTVGTGSEAKSITFLPFRDAQEARSYLVRIGLRDPNLVPGTRVPGDQQINEVEQAIVYTSQPHLFVDTLAQIIPCRRVWEADGREIQAGVVMWEGI